MLKKVMHCIIAIIMVFSLSGQALAADTSPINSTVENGVLTIYANSSEEVDEVLSAIEASNAQTALLWEQAQLRVNNNDVIASENDHISPYALTTKSCSITYKPLTSSWAGLYAYIYCNTSSASGFSQITSVNTVGLSTTYSNQSMYDWTYEGAIIDSGRTYAVTYAFTIKIVNASTGGSSYTSGSAYVEFYASSSTGKYFS